MLNLMYGIILLVGMGIGYVSLRSGGRTVGGILLTVVALIWAFFRYWFLLDHPWFIIRPLGGGWIQVLIVILVLVLIVEFALRRGSQVLGWLALIIALFAPFWDMRSADVWWWAATWEALLAFAVLAFGLSVLFWSSRRIFAVVMLIVALLLGGRLLFTVGAEVLNKEAPGIPAWTSMSQSAGSSDTGSSDSAPGDPAATTTVAADPDYQKLAKAIAREMKDKKVRPDEYTTNVNWSAHAPQNNLGFVDQTLKNRADIAAFLQGDSEASVAARTLVLQAMAEKFDDPVRVNTEMERALSGECYIPIQFTADMQYEGQPYYDDEVVLTPDGYRQAKPGDVLWLCMSTEGEVIWKASMRADCGNVGFTDIRPVRPQTPAAPPVTEPHGPKDSCPTVPGYQGPNSQCLQPKSPAPQPSGVSDLNEGAAGSAQPKPSSKPSPLAPSASPSGGGGSSSGGSDGHTTQPSPEASGTQTGAPDGP